MNDRRYLDLNTAAVLLRKKLGFDPYTPVDILEYLQNQGNYTLVYAPLSERISGISYKLSDEYLIVINSNFSLGRVRFTAAHELYHLHIQEKIDYTICENNFSSTKAQEEIDADQFASYFLAPNEAVNLFVEEVLAAYRPPLSIEAIIRIEQHFKMSHKATLVRLQSDGFIDQATAETNSADIKKNALRLGFPTTLYEPLPEKYRNFTSGNYLKKANSLYEKGAISRGKLSELLFDAFRGDEVLGSEAQEVFPND